MSDINKYTTKEVLNKVLLDSSGNAVNAYSHTSQEAFNAALDDANSRLNVNLVGGTIGGDVTIDGDLIVNGTSGNAYDEIVNGNLHIKSDSGNSANAFLVEKNDGTDVFVVDTTNVSGAGINTAAGGWGLNVKGVDANVFKVLASDGNTLSFLQGTNGDATQKWFADGNDTKVLINTNGSSYFTGGNVGIGTASPDNELHITDGSAGSVTANSNSQVTIESNSHASLQFLSPNNANSIIYFGDADDNDVGYINYAHSSNTMNFQTNAVVRLSIDGSGNSTFAGSVGVGASPVSSFPAQNVTIEGATAGLVLRDSTGSNQATQFFTLYSSNGDIIGMFDDSKSLKFGHSDDAVGTNYEDVLTLGSDNSATFTGDITVSKSGNAFLNLTSTGGGARIKLTGQANETTNGLLFYEASNQRGQINYNHSDQKMEFKTGDSTTLALTLDSSQNATFAGAVMINSSSANYADLTVGGTGDIVALRASSGTAGFTMYEAGTGRFNMTTLNGSNGIAFKTPSTTRMIIDDNSRISLSNNDSGTSGNTIFGKLAGDDLASGGNYNSLFGEDAGHAITTGDGNVIVGHTAGQALTTGVRNVLLGRGAGLVTTNAQHLIGIGFYSLSSVNSADASGAVAVGYESLKSLTSGAGNTSIGYQSSEDVTTGEYNTVMGYQAFSADTDGSANVVIGWKAGRNIHGSTQNVMIGYKAMANMDNNPGDNIANCVAIGYEAFLGSDNDSTGTTTATNGTVAIGHSALKALTTGSGNMGIGYLAGTSLTSGVNNVAIGANALDELSTGGYNTAIGVNALHQVDNGEAENVAIGYNAGSNLDGDGGTASGNVCIGSQAIPSSSGGLNQIVIGKDTTGVANNSVTLGNASVTDVYMAQDQRAKMHSGQIETIMDSSTNANIAVIRSENSSDYSSSVLHVTGDRTTTNNTYNLANFTNAGTSKCVITDGGDLKNTNNSYGAISDEKLKQDIEDASSQWDDIKAVRFRKFKFKDNVEDGFKLGVVAQELEKVSPSLISESIDRDADGKDLGTTTKSVKYSILQMKGIVALQEALNRIETLEAKVKELESK